jgi:hypothetical protein
LKIVRIISTAILSLLLGFAGPAYAQHERGEKQDHGKSQGDRHDQSRLQPHDQREGYSQKRDDSRPQRPEHNNQRLQPQQRSEERHQEPQHTERHQDYGRQQHAQQERRNEPVHRTHDEHVRYSAWQQHRSRHWESDHRNWRQRGGYHGYRIPEDYFRGYFGPDHGFRLHGLPFLVVGGYPRFQYQGYWFSAVDPWPEYWGEQWYDNDDVYVTYVDNGYYLYNRRYPTVGIAISISR